MALRDYRGLNVAVLGASGFIGRWVAQKLSLQGAALSLFVRNRPAALEIFRSYGIAGEVVELDLQDSAGLCRRLERFKPSVVFNLAGYGVDRAEQDPDMSRRINVRLVQVLGEALVRPAGDPWRGQTLIHVGSALEYGTIGGNLAENSEPCPTTLYGQSKFSGTRWLTGHCAKTGLKAIIVRPFTVYGPGEHSGRLLPSLLEAARTRRLLPLTEGTQRRDFIYVEDVAEGLLRLGRSMASPGQIVNLATGRLTSVRDFAQTAATILGMAPAQLGFGIISSRLPEMEHGEVTIARLRRLTRWAPQTPISEGTRRATEFLSLQNTGRGADERHPHGSSGTRATTA